MDSIVTTLGIFVTAVGSGVLTYVVARLQTRVSVLEERERFHVAALQALSSASAAPYGDTLAAAGYARAVELQSPRLKHRIGGLLPESPCTHPRTGR